MIWRKLLLVLSFFAILQSGHAQIAKGTIMAGGDLGFQFSTDKQSTAKDYVFHLTPQLGGFIAKNFVLGIAPTFVYASHVVSTQSIDNSKNPPVTIQMKIKTNTLSLGLGPFLRYYIRIGPKLYLFIHGSPSILASWEKHSTEYNPQPANTNTPLTVRTVSAAWILGPGLSISVAKNIAVEAGLYYTGIWHQSNQYQNGNLVGKAGQPYVDHGMVLNVGFQVYFERKKKEATAPK